MTVIEGQREPAGEEPAAAPRPGGDAPRSWSLRTWRLPRRWHDPRDLVSPQTTLGAVVRGTRLGLVATWAFAMVMIWHRDGVPFDAQTLLLWIAIGLAAACFGRHPVWLLWVLIDVFPFAAALLAYDRLRGFSYQLGLPAWWHPQIDIDRVLGLGRVPTVWLQEHLKYAHVQWWDVAICLVYISYFFVPYVIAGVLWLRGGRSEFYRWTLRFVALSFVAYAFFAIAPTAPPWAAARCSAAEVAGHPADPRCLYYSAQYTPSGGILGPMHSARPGADKWVEPIVYRGFGELHIKYFGGIIQKGHEYFDAVAAVPSLHVGATTMVVLFLWRRTPKWLRPLLASYPVLMSFTLVYSAEHYVFDCLVGAAAAVAVNHFAGRIERRRTGYADPDRLASSSEGTLEQPCLPTPPPAVPNLVLPHGTPQIVLPHGTTPSST